MGISLSFVHPSDIDDATIAQISALAGRYLDLAGDWFSRRIRECDRVILYRDRETGRVLGTTTLDIVDVDHEGRRVRVLYTGAVVLDDDVRGRWLLQRAGIGSVLRFGLFTTRRVYWFCECDSFRGYRASMGYAQAWPRRDEATPPVELRLYERLCRQIFGDAWNPRTGICAPIAGRVLKRSVAEVPAEVLRSDEDVAWFVARNPGYLRGEALPVLVPLDLPNWVSMGLSMAGLRRRQIDVSKSASAA